MNCEKSAPPFHAFSPFEQFLKLPGPGSPLVYLIRYISRIDPWNIDAGATARGRSQCSKRGALRPTLRKNGAANASSQSIRRSVPPSAPPGLGPRRCGPVAQSSSSAAPLVRSYLPVARRRSWPRRRFLPCPWMARTPRSGSPPPCAACARGCPRPRPSRRRRARCCRCASVVRRRW